MPAHIFGTRLVRYRPLRQHSYLYPYNPLSHLPPWKNMLEGGQGEHGEDVDVVGVIYGD